MQQKTLFRLDLDVPEAQLEPFTAFLFDRVAYGWEEAEPAGGAVRFTVHMEEHPACEALVAAIAAEWPDVSVSRSEVENQDWALAWREFFTPVPVGETFLVVAPWMEEELAATKRIPIIIEPKTAFGTGHHATTALCLEVVAQLHDAGRIAAGMRFLDLGCGSGILGLGCAKLGLTGQGVDIDPLATENALENKEVNHVDDTLFPVRTAAVEDADKEPVDLVLANILARPLMDLAGEIVSRLKPDACLVLSGLLATQADDVTASYTALGLPEPRQVLRGEWAALVFRG